MNTGWFTADGWLNQTILAVGDWMWTYVMLAALVLCSLYFTLRTRGVQFTMLREMVHLLLHDSTNMPAPADPEEQPSEIDPEISESSESSESSKSSKSSKNSQAAAKSEISSLQAFAVSIAARVGTGNLAGVATAIAVGGPGAVFWMWALALLGSSMAFVESTLAQLYKRRRTDSFVGGPAYYIMYGLHCRWLAVVFAILVPITFGMSFNMIQANTICGAMQNAFGVSPIIAGVVMAGLALFIAFGGIQRISSFSNIVVPIMAVGYLLIALVVIALNITKLPEVLRLIVEGAFGWQPVAGGTLGTTIIVGVKRGLFSNEAGEGSTPNIAATAAVSHPVKQGLVQALGVFTDTLLVCSCTAFIILLSGVYTTPGLNGVDMTQAALQSQIGTIGPAFVAIAITMFAFTSIMGFTYYGEANIRFLTSRRWPLTVFRFISAGGVVILGGLSTLDMVWNIGDVFMAIITAVNLTAIILLGRKAFELLDDYRRQKRAGVDSPVYHNTDDPDITAWN